jgi:acetyl-CoA carboxylase alpha subunit
VPLHPLQTEWDADLRAGDPLGFPGYEPPGPPGQESVLTGRTTAGYALIEGRFDVLGGSMGAAHGERVVRAYRRAAAERLPVVVVTASGGARLQEGMVALVQLARTVAAARDHAVAGLLQVAVLRGPTTGGVYASYASVADVVAAEPGAMVGFAGPRVVELTTGERVPADSHTAESAYAAGLVDALVPRERQPAWVEVAVGLTPWPPARPVVRSGHSHAVGGGAWGEVQRARSELRPTGTEWAAALCSSWTPLRGSGDGGAVEAGLAALDGRRVVVVAMARRWRPGPGAYRLVQRAAALAGRLDLPLLTLVDTAGADPSPASEAGGLAREIASTFAALDALPTASVSVCVGEGGSGGALALAHADRLLLLEHAVFSVIAPEGAAAILDRSADEEVVARRAGDLKLTAADLLSLGIVDAVLPEDEAAVRAAIVDALGSAVPGDRRRRADAATARWLR